ncbi:MAG: hypothetical protein MSIBF_03100 [Candidatus Altiarchaeales archaeon IMC4]|nr:MAG: hypothetical protein MSIBF_03100 [Candidatus Altiarchaeales archaeon IMC4]
MANTCTVCATAQTLIALRFGAPKFHEIARRFQDTVCATAQTLMLGNFEGTICAKSAMIILILSTAQTVFQTYLF